MLPTPKLVIGHDHEPVLSTTWLHNPFPNFIY